MRFLAGTRSQVQPGLRADCSPGVAFLLLTGGLSVLVDLSLTQLNPSSIRCPIWRCSWPWSFASFVAIPRPTFGCKCRGKTDMRQGHVAPTAHVGSEMR